MTAASVGVVLVAVLMGACAHRATLSQQAAVDEDVVAQAVSWIIKAAPAAKMYSVQIAGRSAGSTLLDGVARNSGLQRVGSQLRQPDGSAGVVEAVAVMTALPQWTEQEASVDISYSSAHRSSVECKVLLRRGRNASEWLLRTPSDVTCWPRPQAQR